MSLLRFSAVVGQHDAKRALLLAAREPRLGGVLLRGEKGSAKTTLARGLAALLPGEAPFVELPLGATEERVIGSLDLGHLLANGEPAFRPGLLAAAHSGVLYVDEINLLADHLVDALLDAAATGVNRVERDGVSHAHEARFVLIASMNPEEGELRPQLLDRFGLAVDVTATSDPAERAEAVRRQLTTEQGSDGGERFAAEDDELRRVLAKAASLQPLLPDDVIATASRLALAVGAEGLRADLMLCRAATAAAALDGRAEVTVDDVRSVAELVLAHRRRRQPFDSPGIEQHELDRAWSDAQQPTRGDRPDEPPEPPDPTRRATLPLGDSHTTGGSSGGFDQGEGPRGRVVRPQPYHPASGLDPHASAIAVAERRATDPALDITEADLRSSQREQRQGSLVVFVLDTSASMGVERRMAATKAAVMGLLADAYRRRGRVALVTFHHDTADVVLRPTASVEIAGARLAAIPTGGTTPLAAGIDAATTLLTGAAGDKNLTTHVVVVTDGRATAGGNDPVEEAKAAIARLAKAATSLTVVDTESGSTRLGLANALAAQAKARYVHLDELGSADLERLARSAST